jgi:hypothetical protein
MARARRFLRKPTGVEALSRSIRRDRETNWPKTFTLVASPDSKSCCIGLNTLRLLRKRPLRATGLAARFWLEEWTDADFQQAVTWLRER